MTFDSAAIALNLSYVLHEASCSAAVQRHVALMRRDRGRRRNLVRHLEGLTDDGLFARVVSDLDSTSAPSDRSSALEVVSVSIGAWELIPRALRASGIVAAGTTVNYTFIDAVTCASKARRMLFRGEAELCAPDSGPPANAQWLFASMPIRPGEQTVLLRTHQIDGVGETGNEQRWARLLPLAEKTIREFVLQWACDRALWERPAEDTLPEFVKRTNGTTECGP